MSRVGQTDLLERISSPARPSGRRTEAVQEIGEQKNYRTPKRAKGRRGRNVTRQNHGQLALLAVPLHERTPHAIRDIPIDVAHLVAGDVFAQLLKIHPPALKMA